MRSLKEFAGFQEVFKTPSHLPDFFQQNLVDPHRIVKVFQEDPQAHIRVFYYQYLKLCFQINSPKSEELVQKIEELINNPNFNFYFYQEDDQTIFNDNQAKAFISEFFGELSSAQCTILDAINSYPIMDVIMVHFFRTLLILMEKSESLDNFIPRDQLLSFLCPFFGIDVEIHDSCIKYVDSDVFVYDLNEKAVFMAYMSDNEENQPGQQINSQEVIDQYAEQEPQVQPQAPLTSFAPQSTVSQAVQAPKPPVIEAKNPLKVEAKESYIASEWNDYTYDPMAARLADKGTILKGSQHQIETKVVEKAKFAQPPPQNNEKNGIKQIPYVETASVSSGSENKNIQQSINSFQSQGAYGQVDYLARSNPVSRPANAPSPQSNFPSDTAIQPTYQPPKSSSYQVPVTQSIPTKDRSEFSQSNQYTSSVPSYQQPSVPSYQQPSAVQNSISSSYSSNLAQDLIYKPKVDNSVFSPSQVKGQAEVNPQSQGYGKKRAFGLNVSDEFTNSLTIKKMAEPFKSNVTNIKQRARQYRNSLNTYIK